MANENILQFNGITTEDINPDDVLSSAIGECDMAIVIGIDKSGEPYYASSIGSTGDTLLAVERFKQFLLDME